VGLRLGFAVGNLDGFDVGICEEGFDVGNIVGD